MESTQASGQIDVQKVVADIAQQTSPLQIIDSVSIQPSNLRSRKYPNSARVYVASKELLKGRYVALVAASSLSVALSVGFEGVWGRYCDCLQRC